MLKKNVVT